MLKKKDKGQTLVEYALILVLIAAGLILSLTTLGSQISSAVIQTSSNLSGGGGGNGGPKPIIEPP